MDVGQARHFESLTASTGPFTLKGGLYALIVDIGDLDSVALEVTMDGTTWLPIPSLQTAAVASGDGGGNLTMSLDADGMRTGLVPPGQYRLTVVGADTDPSARAVVVRIQ